MRHYERVNITPKITTSDDALALTARVDFTAFGREFVIHLRTHHALFNPGFRVEMIGQNGRTIKQNIDTRAYVTGYIEGEVGSTIHGRVTENTLDIVINSQRDSYHVEPASKYGLEGDLNSVIYRSSDVVYELEHRFCTSTDSPRLKLVQGSVQQTQNTMTGEFLKRKKRQADRNTCSLKIVADYQFYRDIGNSLESATLEIMMDHVMAADSIYRSTTFDSATEEFVGFGLSVASAQIYMDENPATNPLVGDFSSEGLLEAFAAEDFNAFCLGHLFTYRDFQGVVGLAYLGDPTGRLAGGICQTRTRTSVGELNLNTGFTSLLNFGNTIPRAVSFITTAHELGHNHGSPHDPSDNPECSPPGNLPKYIMFPSATGNGLKEFSSCSRRSIGNTLETRSSCFVQRPSSGECGDGIVQPGEECDCGTKNETECVANDPCCTVNCTLVAGANCSATANSCCNQTTCQPLSSGFLCRTGDIAAGGCQDNSVCDGISPSCPSTTPSPNGTSCNDGQNVCEDGSCIGSPCPLFNGSMPCFCSKEEELCDVCCLFDGEASECVSTFSRAGVNGTSLIPGSPCANFSGYCDRERTCLRINNDGPLDDLKDILLDGFTTIAEWLESNWYWILVGFAGFAILLVLIQVTYRRKKIKTEEIDGAPTDQGRGDQRRSRRGRQGQGETYGYFQTASRPLDDEAETSTLITHRV